MKNISYNVRTIIIATMIGVVTLAVFGLQQAQAALKKAVAEGRSIRVSEINSCPSESTGEAAQFSGCNSII